MNMGGNQLKEIVTIQK